MKISWVKQWRWKRCICPFKYLRFFPSYRFKMSLLYFTHIAVAAELMKLWFKQVPHALLSRLWFEGSSVSWLNMLRLTKNSAEQMVIMASESWGRMTDIWHVRAWQRKTLDLPGSCLSDKVAAYSIYRFAIAPSGHFWANKKSCIQPFLSWANSLKQARQSADIWPSNCEISQFYEGYIYNTANKKLGWLHIALWLHSVHLIDLDSLHQQSWNIKAVTFNEF